VTFWVAIFFNCLGDEKRTRADVKTDIRHRQMMRGFFARNFGARGWTSTFNPR
jgi:hypothetical protein